mmetsp:Transcript_15406/g.48575  ORF Transcript_15406/g.48575 Transcript_15406/m.48575 type:complete len:482 (+) Transcript_15406:627-2072(+)
MASRECSAISRGRYCAKPRAPLLRGTMDTLSRGSACSRNQPITAWPDSCSATVRFSWGLMRLLLLGRPLSTRSVARSKSCISTDGASLLAATIAASLQMFAMSAPAKPGVSAAMRLATLSLGNDSCNVTGFRWTMKTASRSCRSGLSTAIWRSKRPGRVSALSSTSARFVPARTTTPVLGLKPSISTSIWFKVLSRSSLPPPPPPLLRLRPTASISSMKTMEGAASLACLKRSRIREGPTPTYISMKSEPLMEKKGQSASPATALASSVLPVPGGPTRRPPLGILAPSFWYLAGSLRKSTNSTTSRLACSRPATSSNFTLDFTLCWPWGKALPMLKMFRPPPEPPIGPPMPPRPGRPPMGLPLPRPRRPSSTEPMKSAVMPRGRSCGRISSSRTYWMGTWSARETPRAACASSSLASKASGVPRRMRSWASPRPSACCASPRRKTRQYERLTICRRSMRPRMRKSLISSCVVISLTVSRES